MPRIQLDESRLSQMFGDIMIVPGDWMPSRPPETRPDSTAPSRDALPPPASSDPEPPSQDSRTRRVIPPPATKRTFQNLLRARRSGLGSLRSSHYQRARDLVSPGEDSRPRLRRCRPAASSSPLSNRAAVTSERSGAMPTGPPPRRSGSSVPRPRQGCGGCPTRTVHAREQQLRHHVRPDSAS